MFVSRSKYDLIVEVWEGLDCESVGAAEIRAIERAVGDRFGKSAVDSPMAIARLLADEGAELRHAEIMELYVERAGHRPYDSVFRNILRTSNLRMARASMRRMENLRRNFYSEGDRDGLRLLREIARTEKDALIAGGPGIGPNDPATRQEIAEWLTIWLGSPELFENWIKLRLNSQVYREKFGPRDR